MSILKIAVHPGRILAEEYLEPMGMSANRLAATLNVPRTRIERLVSETTSMTVDTALRLSTAYGTSPEYWMNMQTTYDLATADISVMKDITPLNA